MLYTDIKCGFLLSEKQILNLVEYQSILLKLKPKLLHLFFRSFNFEDTRLDEALRMFLESFRLPGEAPVISYIMEHFSASWHVSLHVQKFTLLQESSVLADFTKNLEFGVQIHFTKGSLPCYVQI